MNARLLSAFIFVVLATLGVARPASAQWVVVDPTSLTQLLIQVQQTAACNALHAVEARLSRWLLQARDRLDSNTIKLTHEFLSQMLGVRRTTVTVVATVLQQAGLIRYHRGQIEIVDRPGLEARACECYEAIRRQIDHVAER